MVPSPSPTSVVRPTTSCSRSSPFDYREPTHVNALPTEYWAEQFARHGFVRDIGFDVSFITHWAVGSGSHVIPFPESWRTTSERSRSHILRTLLAQAHDRIHHMECSWFWRVSLAHLRTRMALQIEGVSDDDVS